MLVRFIFLAVVLVPLLAAAQAPAAPKTVFAMRAIEKPVIDGQPEALWSTVPVATEFVELNPTEGRAPRQRTEVQFLYTNAALYVFARCYDTAPDSILAQLGERDDDLNADLFDVKFDTYNSKLDAYTFGVSASGVQYDYRMQDPTYNAVWNSAVSITPEGWTAELEIPYSALRFPSEANQSWGLQITRSIRRHRSFLQWSLTPKNNDNFMTYWGQLQGISDIKAPVRLSAIPYITAVGEHSTVDNPDNPWSYRATGGLDIKYGLDESFTLDMTLLPDFSQARSDNNIKNLSAFEVVFEEQRQFFQEGVELFSSGDLFYTRRIGGRPMRFWDVEDEVAEGEELEANPAAARLLNASKISGRTPKGTGIGFFNAVTGNTYATVRQADGSTRKELTDPLTNYNIAVVDRNLRNNSRIFLINTNVTRNGHWYDANVTSAGVRLVDKGSAWRLLARGAHSIQYGLQDTENGESTRRGTAFAGNLQRIKGRWRGAVDINALSPEYDHNDLGVVFRTGIVESGGWVGYNIFDPVWKINRASASLGLWSSNYWESGRQLMLKLSPEANTTFRNFLSVWGGMEILLQDHIDYWEPRVDGRYFREPRYTFGYMGFSSDYRKRLALDGSVSYGAAKAYGGSTYNMQYLEPIWRVSDKFTLRHRTTLERERNDQGFATFDDDDQPVFGSRDVTNLTNLFQAKYLFQNNVALSLRVRHLWSLGTYHQFYHLQPDGNLLERDWEDTEDFNFNAFNIDLVFNWQVAPGSFLRVVYKNSILNDATEIERNYWRNLNRTLGLEQTNALSVRLVWFLDYLDFKKK